MPSSVCVAASDSMSCPIFWRSSQALSLINAGARVVFCMPSLSHTFLVISHRALNGSVWKGATAAVSLCPAWGRRSHFWRCPGHWAWEFQSGAISLVFSGFEDVYLVVETEFYARSVLGFVTSLLVVLIFLSTLGSYSVYCP